MDISYFTNRLITRAILLVSLCISPALYADKMLGTTAKEYQIKAVFLYNFSNFITWPESSFGNESVPFRICVLGQDPFGVFIDATTDNQKVKGRSLQVLRLKELNATRQCQILFISDSETSRLTDILAFAKSNTVLTVGESDEFINEGGMIKFFNRNNKVRLGINPDALEQAGLKADANLLNLSEIMRTSPRE